MRFLKGVLIFAIVVSVIASACAIAVFLYLREVSLSTVPEELVDGVKRSDGSTVYYYCDGDPSRPEILSEQLSSSASKYKYTPISEIPDDLVRAFIAIEDKRFYEHSGVDMPRSAYAVFNYVVKRSSSFGASTITQQLVKNLTGRAERTPSRKINEAFMAINFEATHTKSEIMELYLNVINLSCGCTGVGAASRYYFSKQPHELDICECATLAAITNNPSYYNPCLHPENTRARRDTVLYCMLEQGYISRDEYDRAVSKPVRLNIDKSMEGKNHYSWFVETVISDLVNDLEIQGYTREYAYNKIFHGGLDIFTTIDPEVQNVLEDYYEGLGEWLGEVRSAMIVMDRYNGDILGIVGGVGEKRGDLIQNYATSTKRPPGSAIKPLSVYAPLIDKGVISWSSIIEDSPVGEQGGREWPRNSNGKYLGRVNVAFALAHSTNTVAVKLLRELGADCSFEFLKGKLGMTSLDKTGDMGEAALGLGQLSRGVTLRELVSGYTVFARGIYSEARSYIKVTDSDGRVILDRRDNQREVISRESADVMTQLLRGVVAEGTASGIELDDRVEVAGKTGTTQGNCDRLFVGYTPSLVAGVWCGNDYATPISANLGNPSVYIWDDVMIRIYGLTLSRDLPTRFEMSDKIRLLTYNKNSGRLISDDPEGETADGWFRVE